MRTTRREFLKMALASTSIAAVDTVGSASPTPGLTDVNVSLSRWPTRRLQFDDISKLVSKLRSEGVTQAWAGGFDALLHKDIASVNARLAAECRRSGRGILVPFGAINPKSPGWQKELHRCVDEHRMPGIRLHPNYHGYKLDDPAFADVLRLAADRRLIVQLALVMEDERMMHPLLRAEPVDTTPLSAVLRETRGVRLVLLNAMRTLRAKPLLDVIAAGEVYVEIAMLEGVGGVGNLLAQVPASRVLFGSHAPFFYLEAALLKLKESPLTEAQLRAIRSANAQRLLAQTRKI